jgi:hypothetical protein
MHGPYREERPRPIEEETNTRLPVEERVVERNPSWMNQFRRVPIRWEKKKRNYLAMTRFACAWIIYN